jgi:hypothetical protein
MESRYKVYYCSHFLLYLLSIVKLPFFFLVVWGFELRASCLVGRHCTAWGRPPRPLCSGYFRDGISIFAQTGLDYNPILHILLSVGWQVHDTMPSSLFSLGWGSCKLFCPGWPGTTILWILASNVGYRHEHQDPAKSLSFLNSLLQSKDILYKPQGNHKI